MSELQVPNAIIPQKHLKYLARRAKQTSTVKPLFDSYEQNKSSENENALVSWVLYFLRKSALYRFRTLWNTDKGEAAAEDWAAKSTDYFVKSLREGKYETVEHLIGQVYSKRRHIKADGLKMRATQEKDSPLFSRDGKTGRQYETSSRSGLIKARVITPLSDPTSEADAVAHRAKAAVDNLVEVRPFAPNAYLNRETAILMRYLPEPEYEFFTTLEQCEWKRVEAAEMLGVKANTIDKQAERFTEKLNSMRSLLTAFQVPREHRHDLADRFVMLVDRLQGLKRSELPKTFAEAEALCAEERPASTCMVHTAPEIVVKHLLRLWRRHAIQ